MDPHNDSGLESLAYAYRKAGRLEEAARKYEEIVSNFQINREAQEDWILAHYELGNIYRDLGEVEKAKEYYGKFLDIWKDADDNIPILDEARNEYALLQ